MSKKFTLPLGSQNLYRQGQGRSIYLRQADGPVTIRIGEVDYPLQVGQGVRVMEGFSGYLITNDHTADNDIELILSWNDYIDNRLAGAVGITGGALSASVLGGGIEASKDPDNAGDFIFTRSRTAGAISVGGDFSLFLGAHPTLAGYPRTIYITRIRLHARSPVRLATMSSDINRTINFSAGVATTASQDFVQMGPDLPLLPQSSGTINWARDGMNIGASYGSTLDIASLNGGEVLDLDLTHRPYVIQQRGAGWWIRQFTVINDGVLPAEFDISIHGRAIA